MLGKIKYRMKKALNIKNSYLVMIGIVSLFLIVGGFSYALFTTKIESKGTLNIITGNLYSFIESDELDQTNSMEIEAGESKTITIILQNLNAIDAKFNLWYEASPDVNVGYDDSKDVPPDKEGYVLKTNSTKVYKIKIDNLSANKQKITFGSEAGLYNKVLAFPSDKKEIEEYGMPLYYEIFHKNTLGTKGKVDTSDSEQTFITGEEPNNYVWYSGKLWRVISEDTSDHSVKLITQWDISVLSYTPNSNNNFENSYAEAWLNDTSVDGFLGNLREPEKFLKMDSKWNATQMATLTKPEKTTLVTDAVGLLNAYEYAMSYTDTTMQMGYLNNGLRMLLLTPYNSDVLVYCTSYTGVIGNCSSHYPFGIRPAINLKRNVKLADGDGSEENPYRLMGDDDTPKVGTRLNTRYSGEYVSFGVSPNNLYRIVSHEHGGAKLVSAEPLKSTSDSSFLTMNYANSGYSGFNPENNAYLVAYWLNHNYLDPNANFLTNIQLNMIDSKRWYGGRLNYLGDHYRLSKYTTVDGMIPFSPPSFAVDTKVGLLRVGEQLAGQFERFAKKGTDQNLGKTASYWLLTAESQTLKWWSDSTGAGGVVDYTKYAVGLKPAFHLKETIQITGGNGTKESPFTISE